MMANNESVVDDATKASTPWAPGGKPPQKATSHVSEAAGIAAHAATEMPFAQKVMNMINDGRFRGALGWSADGDSFCIWKRDIFKARVLPAYFGSIQVKSFKKRLSRHGFETRQICTLGREDTAFFHPNFRRDRPELCILIVPLTTTKTNKKRVREEIHNQLSDKPSSSFSPPSSDENSLQAYQQPSRPVEMQPLVKEQTIAPTEEENMAAASLCAVSQQMIAEVTIEQRTWCEAAAAKRMRDTPNATTQEVSMAAQFGTEAVDSTTRSHGNFSAATRSLSSAKTVNVVHSEQQEEPLAEVPSQDQNEEEQRATQTSRASTHTEAAPPQGDVPLGIGGTPPKILRNCPYLSRGSQYRDQECNVTPHDQQGTVEPSIADSGKHENKLISEDELPQIGPTQEKQRNEPRAGTTIEKPADGCGGIHPPNGKIGCRAAVPLEQQLPQGHGIGSQSTAASVNAATLQTVQQQWLQSELQAAAMSAQAAFLRQLFLQILGARGTFGILGGAFSASLAPQQGNVDLVQQRQQVEENGLTQEVVNLGGPPLFPGDGSEQNQSLYPHQQTSLARDVSSGAQMSAAQDPVAVMLEMASSPSLQFSS